MEYNVVLDPGRHPKTFLDQIGQNPYGVPGHVGVYPDLLEGLVRDGVILAVEAPNECLPFSDECF